MIEPRGRSVLDTRLRGYDVPVSVIARAQATKQSILSLCGDVDCFAALAKTEERFLADYPSGVTEIRAQSRRPISTQSWVLRRSAMLTASQMPMAVSATVKASAAILASMR